MPDSFAIVAMPDSFAIVAIPVFTPMLLRLAEEGAVSAGDQDGGARGSGQQGHSTLVGGLLSYCPQGADPGVAVSGVLYWGDFIY